MHVKQSVYLYLLSGNLSNAVGGVSLHISYLVGSICTDVILTYIFCHSRVSSGCYKVPACSPPIS